MLEMNDYGLKESIGSAYIKMRIEKGIGNEDYFLSDLSSNVKRDGYIRDNEIGMAVIYKLVEKKEEQFARELYKVLLNREVEVSALNNIKKSLHIGNSKQEIILEILKSQEFRDTNRIVKDEVYTYLNGCTKSRANKYKIYYNRFIGKIQGLSRVNRLKAELEEAKQRAIVQEERYQEYFWEGREALKKQEESLYVQREKLEEYQKDLKEFQKDLEEYQKDLEEYQKDLEKQQENLEERQKQLEKQQNNTELHYQQMKPELDEQGRLLNELQISFDREIELEDIVETAGVLGKENIDQYIDDCLSDRNEMFYGALENMFRGSYESILENQKKYMKYIDLSVIKKNDIFLDLGCGRGEFLEILRNNGIHGRGIDMNGSVVQNLQLRGFDAVQMDIYKYLEQMDDCSVVGVSSFQVIEHLEFEYLKNLVRLAYKKMKEDGTLILETVNPYCIWGLGSYYIDPTHIKLYAADMMKVLLRVEGFRNIKIVYYAPITKELRTEANIFANYAGYAIIAKK